MPVLARVYRIPLKEQPELTLSQFRAIQRDYHEQQQVMEGGELWHHAP